MGCKRCGLLKGGSLRVIAEIEECSEKDGSGILDQYGADGGDLQVCKFC